MKKTEIIFAAMALIGLLFKCLFWPFAGLLITIGLLGLSCFYFYFSFALFNNIPLKKILKKESYTADISEKRDYRILIAVFWGTILSILLTGLLFYLMRWPFAFLLITAGIILSIPMLIISTIRFDKTKSTFYIRIFIRVAIIGGIALFFRLMPSTTWLEFQYRNHPKYIELLKDSWNDPDNIELQKKIDEYWDNYYK